MHHMCYSEDNIEHASCAPCQAAAIPGSVWLVPAWVQTRAYCRCQFTQRRTVDSASERQQAPRGAHHRLCAMVPLLRHPSRIWDGQAAGLLKIADD